MKKVLLIFVLICSIKICAVNLFTEKFQFENEIYTWELRTLESDGSPVNHYKKENFNLFYSTIVNCDVLYDKEPAAFAVILDRSRSLIEFEQASKKLFFEALALIPANSEKMYGYFNNRIEFFKKISDSEPTSWNIIENLKFEGSTAFYDTLYYASKFLSESRLEKKFIIIVTDGIDEVNIGEETKMSQFPLDFVIERLQKDGVKVITLLPQTKRTAINTLEKIKMETDGGVFTKSQDVDKYLKEKLRNRFSITFEDPFRLTETSTREVTVAINYRGDTLNLFEEINVKKNQRYWSREIESYLKDYKIIVDDIITDYPKVILNLYGYDKGRNIPGPSKNDIKVVVKSEIVPFEWDFIYDNSYNMIVFDKSASMKIQWDKTTDFLTEFLTKKEYFDRFSLITFDSRARLFSDFSDSVDAYMIKNKIRPSGSTAFYDALVFSAMALENYRGHKSIITFTDGLDQRYEEDVAPLSKYKYEYARGILKSRGIPVYVINYNEKGNIKQLTDLSIYTGGAFFLNPTEKSADELHKLLRRSKSGIYRIKFDNPVVFESEFYDITGVVLIENGRMINYENRVINNLKLK